MSKTGTICLARVSIAKFPSRIDDSSLRCSRVRESRCADSTFVSMNRANAATSMSAGDRTEITEEPITAEARRRGGRTEVPCRCCASRSLDRATPQSQAGCHRVRLVIVASRYPLGRPNGRPHRHGVPPFDLRFSVSPCLRGKPFAPQPPIPRSIESSTPRNEHLCRSRVENPDGSVGDGVRSMRPFPTWSGARSHNA